MQRKNRVAQGCLEKLVPQARLSRSAGVTKPQVREVRKLSRIHSGNLETNRNSEARASFACHLGIPIR